MSFAPPPPGFDPDHGKGIATLVGILLVLWLTFALAGQIYAAFS